jgi:hypothetical protein
MLQLKQDDGLFTEDRWNNVFRLIIINGFMSWRMKLDLVDELEPISV